MKGLISKIFLMVGVVLTLGIAANAQMSQQYHGSIPFDFEAGGKKFSAGDYKVGPWTTHGTVGVLTISERKDSRKMATLGLVSLNSNSSSTKGKLIFVKRDGRYALSQISTPTFAANMKKRTWTDVKVTKNHVPAEETVVAILLH